jgi:hypothetical protein
MVVKVVCLILKRKDSQDPQEERSSIASSGKILKRKEPQEERSSRASSGKILKWKEPQEERSSRDFLSRFFLLMFFPLENLSIYPLEALENLLS